MKDEKEILTEAAMVIADVLNCLWLDENLIGLRSKTQKIKPEDVCKPRYVLSVIKMIQTFLDQITLVVSSGQVVTPQQIAILLRVLDLLSGICRYMPILEEEKQNALEEVIENARRRYFDSEDV